MGTLVTVILEAAQDAFKSTFPNIASDAVTKTIVGSASPYHKPTGREGAQGHGEASWHARGRLTANISQFVAEVRAVG